MNNILLVEDSKDIYQMVALSTSQVAELTWAKSVEEAKLAMAKQNFDLILLDVELPDGNGIDFCSTIQMTHSHISIFFLSGNANLSDKVLGFSAGADDYITKPFSPLELRARLEARLKKNKFNAVQSDQLKWKELQINKSSQEVQVLEKESFIKIDLTSLEFKILMYFASRPGVVIIRDQILNDIWGENIHVYQRSVDTHVSKLRKKLGPASHIVESIHGTGYKFNPTAI